MKQSIRKNLLKIASALGIIATLPTSTALADSIYDGIWQMGYVGRDGVWQPKNSYFSITMRDNTVVVADLSAIAYYKNTMKGAFFGSFSEKINLMPLPLPNNPLSIRVTLDPEVTKAVNLERAEAVRENPFALIADGGFFYSWQINFTSRDSATIHRPWKDYPSTDFPPPFTLRKVF